jgi:hypothetical protein
MPTRIVQTFLLTGLLLAACRAETTPPTPDPAALNAAVETAVAATRAAEVPTIPTPTLPTPTPTSPAATQPPAQIPTQTPLCTVVNDGEDLRFGPGTVYQPPLEAVAAGTELTPLAFIAAGFPEGQWLQIQIRVGGQIGWINAGPQVVACNLNLSALPVGLAPPTPAPTALPQPPTPTPLPPTPTPPQRASLPPDGGQSDLQGLIILPGISPAQVTTPMVFYGKLALQVEVYDPYFGQFDGAGIDNVRFTVQRDDGDDTELYARTEINPGYCIFSGGEPNCNVLFFAQTNYRWPETNYPIVDGPHRVFMQITQKNGNVEQWNWGFEIRGALAHAPAPSNLIAQIVQTGPGTTSNVVNDALVFQVFASTDGSQDGVGIDRVDLRIIGPHGEVYRRTEQNAGYCAFSGGEPHCNVWGFAEHGFQWPNGNPIEPGAHTLRATVFAMDGNETSVETVIQIQ